MIYKFQKRKALLVDSSEETGESGSDSLCSRNEMHFFMASPSRCQVEPPVELNIEYMISRSRQWRSWIQLPD
jgi:hypothetical protein